jgi:hypothetical protein
MRNRPTNGVIKSGSMNTLSLVNTKRDADQQSGNRRSAPAVFVKIVVA